jgi:hypothetical protein
MDNFTFNCLFLSYLDTTFRRLNSCLRRQVKAYSAGRKRQSPVSQMSIRIQVGWYIISKVSIIVLIYNTHIYILWIKSPINGPTSRRSVYYFNILHSQNISLIQQLIFPAQETDMLIKISYVLFDTKQRNTRQKL